MKAFSAISTALAAATLLFNAVSADVDPIVIKGSKFFYQSNGTQFYIKGVAYQQDYTGGGAGGSGTASGGNNQYVDPLASPSNCQRDIPYLVQLQTNTIRVYAIDPTQNHDECMSMLADAGIYVIADLSAPGDSINRADPTWDDTLYARYTSVIDVMQKYTNTLGFFAGNEVSNNSTNTDASAFVKAAVRDMKAYIKAKNYRTIGVGYATNDDAEIRVDLADYFNCGDPTDAIDFWGYNIYSWCGASSYTLSGYNERTAEFSTYSVPVFFAEYGCNQVQPRIFTEVAALYGPQMNDVWSGGIVYMYFQEANDYGLVSVNGNSVQTLTDFDNLSSQIAKVSPTGVNAASYNPTNSPQACPSVGADWGADSNLPPTPNEQLCDCMYSALTCQPSSEVTDTNIGELFGLVCGLSELACLGISANATEGQYGAYSQCNPNQQMGWALNAYYEIQSQASDACDFSGSATINPSPVSPTGTCSELVSQAGGQGTGTVTSAPTNTGGSSSPGSTGSGSTSSGAAVPGMSALASLNFGVVHIAAYLVLAVGTGAGMILL